MAEQLGLGIQEEEDVVVENSDIELTDDENPMAPDAPKKSFSKSIEEYDEQSASADREQDEEKEKLEKEEEEEEKGEAKAQDTDVEVKKDGDVEEKKVSTHVPYNRFRGVNEEKNYWKQRFESSQQQKQDVKQEQMQQPQQPQTPTQTPQESEDEFILTPEQLKILKEHAPDKYEDYQAARIAAKAEKMTSQKIAAQQRQAAVNAEVQNYTSFYDGRLAEDFGDLQKPDSELLKTMKPQMQAIIDAYPITQRDVGALHMGLKLAKAEMEIAALKERLGKVPTDKQREQNRIQKKQAALAGEAVTPETNLAESDDPFNFEASFEKKRR